MEPYLEMDVLPEPCLEKPVFPEPNPYRELLLEQVLDLNLPLQQIPLILNVPRYPLLYLNLALESRLHLNVLPEMHLDQGGIQKIKMKSNYQHFIPTLSMIRPKLILTESGLPQCMNHAASQHDLRTLSSSGKE